MFLLPEIDLPSAGAHGGASLYIKVDGYWSSSSITLYIRRDWRSHVWSAEVSHSSGGRDTEEEPDNLIASTNFGNALIETAKYGHHIIDNYATTLESYFQEQQSLNTAQREAERTAQAAKVEADTPLTELQAKLLIKIAKDTAVGYQSVTILLFSRGAEISHPLERTPTSWIYNGSRIHRDKVLPLLLTMSHRSCIK